MAKAVPAVACVLLVISAVALSMDLEGDAYVLDSHDGPEELGESEFNGNGVAVKTPTKGLRSEDRLGLRILDEYEAANGHLQKTEAKLRAKIANPPEATEGNSYHKIPGYKMTYMSRTLHGKSRASCELVCNTYSACKSYSYNKEKRICVWSMSQVKYDPEFRFYAKNDKANGAMYTEIPGMLVQNKIKKSMEKVSHQECKYACSKDSSCHSFSYSEGKTLCHLSSTPVHYATGFNYYEKDLPLGQPEYKKKNIKENKRKDELKQKWMKASTAPTRETIEKDTKVVTKLKVARKTAVSSEQGEKQARKSFQVEDTKCTMAKARADESQKRNMQLLSQVSTKNLDAVKKNSAAEKLQKLVKKKTHYEGASKAKLRASMAIESSKEASQKHLTLKTAERTEKTRSSRADERRTKVCSAMASDKVEFKSNEARMKSSEAVAEEATEEKKMGRRTREYRREQAAVGRAKSGQSAAAMEVAIAKTGVEAAVKKERTAATERQRKTALADKTQATLKLKKEKSKLTGVKRKVLVAQEKRSKVKENLVKDKLKEQQAQQLVAKKKKETAQKDAMVAQKKKLQVKKEKNSKSEKIAKANKKKEVLSKRTGEGKSKAEKGQKKVKKDVMTQNEAAQAKERSYKNLARSKTQDKKLDASRRAAMNLLARKEKATKATHRKNLMVMSNLNTQEKSAKRAAKGASQQKERSSKDVSAKEKTVKGAAASVQKSKTEAETKSTQKSERSAKAMLSLSKEKLTKNMKKESVAHSNHQRAGAKVQLHKCVLACSEGRKQQEAINAAKAAKEIQGKSLEKAARAEDLGESAGRPAAVEIRQKGNTQKAKAEELKQKADGVPTKFSPAPDKPFTYKGCSCPKGH